VHVHFLISSSATRPPNTLPSTASKRIKRICSLAQTLGDETVLLAQQSVLPKRHGAPFPCLNSINNEAQPGGCLNSILGARKPDKRALRPRTQRPIHTVRTKKLPLRHLHRRPSPSRYDPRALIGPKHEFKGLHGHMQL
jgi:hypothetical protein